MINSMFVFSSSFIIGHHSFLDDDFLMASSIPWNRNRCVLFRICIKNSFFQKKTINYFRIPMSSNTMSNLKILYEDDHIVAVDKVCNMLSVPGLNKLPEKAIDEGGDEEESDLIPLPSISAPYTPRYLEWKRVAQYTYDHSTLDETAKLILARVLESESLPRRKKKFFAFLDKITKPILALSSASPTKKMEIYESLWKELSRVDFELYKQPIFDSRDPGEQSVCELLEARYGHRIFHIHRLDQETSGILLFARTDTAASHMCSQFRDRKVTKIYRALVDGVVDPTLRRIDASIRADLDNRPMQVPKISL